jgi:hypothetical protein
MMVARRGLDTGVPVARFAGGDAMSLRWSASDRHTVDHPRAFLTRVVSRLCLDRMKSATSRR